MLWHIQFSIIVLYAFVNYYCVESWLLFPTSTVLQITASVSVPVELKEMKLYFDWGFQVNYNLPFALSNFYNIPKWPGHSRLQARSISYSKYAMHNGIHPSDATAGEIYLALEGLMIGYGFHETCLLKSVCEVARHPFDLQESGLISEIINFVLSPSLHNAFGRDEKIYKEAYEAAEKYGTSRVDCSFMYPECTMSFIDSISNVIFD